MRNPSTAWSWSRRTMVFFLPNGMEAILDDQPSLSESDDGVGWYKANLYINPQSVGIREKKFIKSDLTKGGFVTQYWGEDLTKLEVRGTTGSSGIEGINVLRSIYRHEQAQFINIINERKNKFAEEAAKAAGNSSEQVNGLTAVADVLTGGAFSQTVDGLSNAVDLIVNSYNGNSAERSSFSGAPTLAALATNVDLYHDGEFFRGYFDYFNVDEAANEPGHFTYSFSFTVLRRTGKRSNFMPWHREALDDSGNTLRTFSVVADKGNPKTGGKTFTFPIAAANETVGPTSAQDINTDLPLIPAPTFPINDEG